MTDEEQRRLYAPVLQIAEELLQKQGRSILAIDGRCGSGKSHLARLLADWYACPVCHMDDYYLPMAARRPDWEKTPAGNMDLQRFLQQVLLPAKAGQPIAYTAYSCAAKAYEPSKTLQPAPLLVVEGSYSMHPALNSYYDGMVFLTCDKAEQKRRLLQRNAARYPDFQQRWIPMEERYYTACGIEALPAVRLDTTKFITSE